jgi:archaellum component FlaC
MGYLEVSLKLDEKEFPMLNNFKKKELDKYLLKIFKTGYQVHFPSNDIIKQQVEYNELIERIETIKDELKDEINNSEINDKINSLETSLTKLIGLSSNSCKKGNFGENLLEDIFSKRYGDIVFERKSQTHHSGDAWLYLPNNKIIMLESKNYTTVVNKDEINKLKFDMINHNIRWGILTSFNSMIQGMKELDFYTFNHNKETYSIIMVSNLATDIHKLDLALQIIRKLMDTFDKLPEFPWIVKDINNTLNELNQIIQKNYMLRDSYYNMERDIQKLMSNYHINLRDYQYDIEQKINEIITKIKSTMETVVSDIKSVNGYQLLLDKYQDKKILPIIVRFVDVAQSKKWNINYNDENNEWVCNRNDEEIGRLKIQNKKAILSIIPNDIELTLHLGKEKENKKNLELIKSL